MSKLLIMSTQEARASSVPWPDVYFSPGYGEAAEASDAGTWEVAVWDSGPIVFPYVKRPEAQEDRFRVTSPYGYAGTWAPPEVPLTQWQAFREALRSSLADRGCTTEFQRCSGLVSGRELLLQADPGLVGRHHNDTIGIDLSQGYDAAWTAAEGRSRTKTRKARKRGYSWQCRVCTAQDVAPGSTFRVLYEATMRRVESTPYYFFNDNYFARLQSGLTERLFILEVSAPDGVVVSSGLFMDWAPRLHLHLVGSRPQALRDSAVNMVYDGLIRWGCEAGRFELLHVGGGTAADDSLFFFKKSFGGQRVPYWVVNGEIG